MDGSSPFSRGCFIIGNAKVVLKWIGLTTFFIFHLPFNVRFDKLRMLPFAPLV